MPHMLNIHEDRKPRYSCFVIIPKNIATRIVVIRKSHLMPDVDSDKNQLMANKASQQIWDRDFDAFQDCLRLCWLH